MPGPLYSGPVLLFSVMLGFPLSLLVYLVSHKALQFGQRNDVPTASWQDNLMQESVPLRADPHSIVEFCHSFGIILSCPSMALPFPDPASLLCRSSSLPYVLSALDLLNFDHALLAAILIRSCSSLACRGYALPWLSRLLAPNFLACFSHSFPGQSRAVLELPWSCPDTSTTLTLPLPYSSLTPKMSLNCARAMPWLCSSLP